MSGIVLIGEIVRKRNKAFQLSSLLIFLMNSIIKLLEIASDQR